MKSFTTKKTLKALPERSEILKSGRNILDSLKKNKMINSGNNIMDYFVTKDNKIVFLTMNLTDASEESSFEIPLDKFVLKTIKIEEIHVM